MKKKKRPESVTPAAIGSEAKNKLVDVLGRLREKIVPKTPGRKGEPVNHQLESLFQSVCEDVLADPVEVVEASNDDAHMEAIIRQRMKWKGGTRHKKGGKHGAAQQFSQWDKDHAPDPADDSAGPGTQVADAEAEGEAFKRFSQTVLRGLTDKTDIKIVKDYIVAIEVRPWVEVAKRAGVSAAAARQRLSRLRPFILQRICEPLRSRLNGESWAVAELLLVKRKKPGEVADILEVSQERIERVYRQSVSPILIELYGTRAQTCIERLRG